MAVELRNRGWVEQDRLEGTLRWLAERGAAFVCVDAPRAEHFTIMPPVDAVTRPDLAYLRLHGRNAEGYLSGQDGRRALRVDATPTRSSRRSAGACTRWPRRPRRSA